MSQRTGWVCLTLVVLLCLGGFYALMIGRFMLPVESVLRVFMGEASPMAKKIVTMIRLPRVLTAILVGFALGVSGAIFQSVSKNVLGSPDVIGFTTGAASGAIIQIILFNGNPVAIVFSAMAGGLVTALLVYYLARHYGVVKGNRLVLMGIGVGAILSALNTLLLVKGDIDNAITATLWLAGTTQGRNWYHVASVTFSILILFPVIMVHTRAINIMSMGDDISSQLGVRVEQTRRMVTFCAVTLAAVATSAAGPIAFIALIAPQLALRLTKTSGIPVFSAGLAGSCLLLGADLITQIQPLTLTIPVGLMTGIIGGVYLLILLLRTPSF
ncbi:iron chelate uptake ABC transporter family permease subunit [Salmonella enterica subsp. enterica serovar Newport]|uniref:Fe(3+)-siderophore ABC transporter permease n=1 Tax=Salmonella newport TaxID=108619 RepID=A0A5U9KV50_SALNE|nr:Fe(3+)-siderophore ABC transporter permease [Salmonella enterica]EBS2695105.1 Fe(3+)-siderophore ABC transporter permease [Salmonella enterica subsp. enterica serovar Newport]EBY9433562.1 Fe(3+)-siderophore ABC transporter permease [Salmonella enterica subsp. enterica serovar Cerro]EIE5050031.1 iron chelate uptake ABC transporter family permease subunit [Salmonella enterica subsp. enterica serovar Java]EBR6512348.1 iron chelate uptake ABC transporter family permease subunit [Salmonella enter